MRCRRLRCAHSHLVVDDALDALLPVKVDKVDITEPVIEQHSPSCLAIRTALLLLAAVAVTVTVAVVAISSAL